VATQVAICEVVMEEGVAVTVTAVTVGCATAAATATTTFPDSAESCAEIALIVSDPETGTAEGAV
jgi:type IV pilus biogenesis protein CpaD/CtpE